jgi:hypothetical protein
VKTWRINEDQTACPTLEQLVKDGILDEDGRRNDPWGTTFKIACAGDDVSIHSAGPDGKFDTEDDLRIPKR